MDYWQHLDWQAVDSWEELLAHLGDRPMWLFTRFATRPLWQAEFSTGDVFVFGSESRGLPETIRQEYAHRCLTLPMRPEVRSLNLASTVNTVLYEGVRQLGGTV
jgi:tRNA (cytidine/uridine-2'-O-)-methyltransferase